MRPPTSNTDQALQPAVRVVISQKDITVEEKVILPVRDGKIVAESGEAAMTQLNEAFASRARIMMAIQERGGPAFDGGLMVICDEKIPFDLLYTVIQSASKSQFNEYRMIVRKK